MKLILGSGSRYRKEELEKAGFVFDVMTADIDEKVIRHNNYYELPLHISRAKHDVLVPHSDPFAILITLDSVVVCNGILIEKPTSREEIFERALLYEQYPTDIVTGVVVTNIQTGKKAEGVDISNIVWGKIDKVKLGEIINETRIFECAGFNKEMVDAFAISHDPMDRLRGMPIELVKKLLDEVQ